MTAAIGGSTAPARPSHGELWVDVRDFGAKADNGATDNSVPFQAAVDSLIGKTSPQCRGIVYIPSSTNTYQMQKSVWVDVPYVEIRGDAGGTAVYMNGPYRYSHYIFGIRRTEYSYATGSPVPVTVGAANRPDLYGKLDTSAVGSPGMLWGIRTNNNTFAEFFASPMSAGAKLPAYNLLDNWSQTTQLTVEFCIEPPDGQHFPTSVPLLGLGDFVNDPAPFGVFTAQFQDILQVNFKTADIGSGMFLPTRSFSFSVAGATAPYRIVLQFDLDNAVCSAYVNGTQVGFTSSYNVTAGGSPPFTPGSKFVTNDHYPFLVGASGISGPWGGSTGVDLRLYGLRISNTLRYQNNGPGKPQVRIDSPATPVNDAYAYFAFDANTVSCLLGTDNPATSGRVVTVGHGNAGLNGLSQGLILHSTPSSGGMAGNAIRDIYLAGGGSSGQAVCLGGVLNMMIERVTAVGAFHAIGNFPMYANYDVFVRDCFLSGMDSAYFGAQQVTYAQNIQCLTSGRATVRHFGGNARWENVFVSFAAADAECIFKIRSTGYGGNFTIESLVVDFEGPTLSTAGILCEICPYGAPSLMLKDIGFGTVGSTASLVMLKDVGVANPGYLNPGWLSVDNLFASTSDYLAAIDVDGPLWHGEVRGVNSAGPTFKHRQKYGTATNVVVRDSRYAAPPRQYLWYKGAHVLEVHSPSDGQFSEFRCVATGTYGTPTPPSWAGLNPLSSTPNALAAYVLNHAYMTAALS